MIEFILHLDLYLDAIIQQYGTLTYAILFLIVFLETGLVVTPFLPGDSLLFAAGALAVKGLSVPALIALLTLAAVLGDTLNYWIGSFVGPRIFKKKKSFIFHKEYLERTHAFYAKHGPKTIVLARFLPIIRTFAPFVAGIGRMDYRKFFFYNVIGGILWVASLVLAGHFFGTIPVVKENFEFVIIGIIVVSLIPVAIEVAKHWLHQANH
jgi:membrane-associated protein